MLVWDNNYKVELLEGVLNFFKLILMELVYKKY